MRQRFLIPEERYDLHETGTEKKGQSFALPGVSGLSWQMLMESGMIVNKVTR
jgi:hypothetical protein